MTLEMEGKHLRGAQEKGPSGLRLDVWSEGERRSWKVPDTWLGQPGD